jgi:hypothetical protein
MDTLKMNTYFNRTLVPGLESLKSLQETDFLLFPAINEHSRIPAEGFLPELGHAKTEEKLLEDGTLEITFSKQVTRKGAIMSEAGS